LVSFCKEVGERLVEELKYGLRESQLAEEGEFQVCLLNSVMIRTLAG
jgi:hypothetical protein